MHRGKRNVAHTLALVLALLMSLSLHHAAIGAQTPVSQNHEAQASASSHSHCSDGDCVISHNARPGCCAMGLCMGSLPPPGIGFLSVGHGISREDVGTVIAARWANDGLDRPPKHS